jgi:CBS domain-containing protein
MDLASFVVASIMHEDFAVLHPDEPLDAIDPIASDLAAVRHLVVVDAKRRVVGILSLRDLLEVSLARLRKGDSDLARTSLRAMAVSDLMSRPVETVGPDEVLAAAANRMITHRIGCLPVVREDGVLLGVVTDADLLAAAYREPRPPGSASTSGSASSSRR